MSTTKGRFAALIDSSDSDEDHPVPNYEDLSTQRADEELVLQAIYGEDDFSSRQGTWGQRKFLVKVRPPDLDDPKQIGCQLNLAVTLSTKYPYVVPKIALEEVEGLSKDDQKSLLDILHQRAKELAEVESVMVCELVQVTEDFLLEHNVDPTQSAWDKEEARRAKEEAENEYKEHEQKKKLIGLLEDDSELESPSRLDLSPERGELSRISEPVKGTSEIERELSRQQKALKDANIFRLRNGGLLGTPNDNQNTTAGSDEENYDDEDDFDDEDGDDEPPPAMYGSSRYQHDFIEMGVLGRGGGGEVVKAKNRLDRRIYAVKKILLEFEKGSGANHGLIQNKKLRREVTTISRMTHKNIVRYYQAWVEGEEAQKTNTILEHEDEEGIDDIKDTMENMLNQADSDEGEAGWWATTPSKSKDAYASGVLHESYDSSSSSNSTGSSAWSDEGRVPAAWSDEGKVPESATGLNDFVEDFGFNDKTYNDLFGKKQEKIYDESQLSDWDTSSVKVDSSKNQSILYIQMEYCATTLRKLIDDSEVARMGHAEVWRLIRQIVEALTYIHSRGIIHRDLKPGNLFIDKSNNIKMGDFGLATKRQAKPQLKLTENEHSEANDIYEAIEDFGALLGETSVLSGSALSVGESLTGGVGTAFYRAPEQEVAQAPGTGSKGESYGVKADIYSLGIVIFEMFHPPFSTYMERSYTLNRLRTNSTSDRFPCVFEDSAPENAKKLIIWCLHMDPSKRPMAEEILKSDLLPREIEVEQRYLEEALELLGDPQADGVYKQLLDAMFSRQIAESTELMYDTDNAVKANALGSAASEGLIRAIRDLHTGTIDITSLSMSNLSQIAATYALNCSRTAMHTAKGGGIKGVLKRARIRTSGILAMTAASTAAVEGNSGRDPRIQSMIESRVESIFQSHGALHLRAPLLRPRQSKYRFTTHGGPAELIDSRGVVLILPEDLTVPFARSVARAGQSASNLKRYTIDRVYHKGLAHLQPRESLEASFDICQDDPCLKGFYTEAELFLVLSRVMSVLKTDMMHSSSSVPLGTKSPPLWYWRITNTRLGDIILDIWGVRGEALRSHCFRLMTDLSAPTPVGLTAFARDNSRKRSMSRGEYEASRTERLEASLSEAKRIHGLSPSSASKLQEFFKQCMPMSPDVNKAIAALKEHLAKMSKMQDEQDDRFLRRFEDATRIVKHLESLMKTLQAIGVFPQLDPIPSDCQRDLNIPLFISLDLGLRQRRKHYGSLFFQAIAIPSDYLDRDLLSAAVETNDTLLSTSGLGMKIAEGGRYDDLTRMFRPPGNFGDAVFNAYTQSSIPKCCGCKISISRLVEMLYSEYSKPISGESLDLSNIETAQGIDAFRKTLGHPLQAMPSPVQCIVASVHGLDSASAQHRLIVASKLWIKGIKCEYLAQSGVIASLLKQQREESQGIGTSDWSLEELCGVCAIMKIPFVVIVQPHLLKDKGMVRLRTVLRNGVPDFSNNTEKMIGLESLVETIREFNDNDDLEDQIGSDGQQINIRDTGKKNEPSVECIYVQNDQFFDYDRPITKETPNFKSVIKSVKYIAQQAENYVTSMAGSESVLPVFAVADLPFMCLREFGTKLMQSSNEPQGCRSACSETINSFPSYKRSIKTLGAAIESYMKRDGSWQNTSGNQKRQVMLLYSKVDDMFDLVTLKRKGNAMK